MSGGSQDEPTEESDPYMSKIQFQSIRNDDGLEEAISVQWQHSGIRMSAPLHLSTLLQPEEIAPLFSGAQWAGTRVWHAAIAALEYLVQRHDGKLKLDQQCRVLELGCGLGVPGMILHSLYDYDVCLTDQPSIISQLRRNLQQNFPDTNESSIRARPLSWSKDGILQLLQEDSDPDAPFDIVLNCDCIYEPLYGTSWTLLVRVMDELLRVNPKTIMLTSVERRTADGVDKFLEELESAQHVSRVDRVFHDAYYKIEMYMAHGSL